MRLVFAIAVTLVWGIWALRATTVDGRILIGAPVVVALLLWATFTSETNGSKDND